MTVCDETPPGGSVNLTFEAFCKSNPAEARRICDQLSEITDVRDRNVLYRALDESRCNKKGGFNVELALEHILESRFQNNNKKQFPSAVQSLSSCSPPPPPPPLAASKEYKPLKDNNRQLENVRISQGIHSTTGGSGVSSPRPPPNSPNSSSNNNNNNSSNSAQPQSKALVDITDVSSTSHEDDLQKAIKLSLEEANKSQVSSGVSQEEQDVSKALEASLLDGGVNRRKRKDKWEDPLNPHDRKRNGVWPVGLKNVGQTCWFSAVIQSLFHLPAFRTLVLNFSIPSSVTSNALRNDKKTRKIVEFMEELRKLFALLVASRRKYVDPFRSVEILKGSIGSASIDNNQQDVSEFTHMVLEWAELAFKYAGVRDSVHDESMDEGNDSKEGDLTTQSMSDNPMANLFYGQVLTEGKNRGLEFSHTDTIGQWTLHVNNFSDIHESLENSTALEYFDNDSLNGQERWFSKLQPVLFFELSRFQFNQERKLAEKIHNKLVFPERIYMDRYMASNKNITRQKREQTRILKEKRDVLSKKLAKFTHYGSRENEKIPLSSILQYAMDFTNSGVSSMQVDSPCHSPKSMMTPASSLANITDGDTSMEVETTPEAASSSEDNRDCDKSENDDFGPSPKHVSDFELKVIQSCFNRWKSEVESDVSSLESSRKELDSQIEDMYSEESLKDLEYRLHAVMVHEGSVDSGHYWAYVYDYKRKTWLKFNDNSVNETTWEELFKESIGGHSNTSAYSLVYVHSSKEELFAPVYSSDSNQNRMEEGEEQGEVDPFESLVTSLPNDLREFVQNDNSEFEKEMKEWDERQKESLKKDIEAVSSTTSTTDELGKPPDECVSANEIQVVKERLSYVNTHAFLVAHLSIKLINSIPNLAEGETINAQEALNYVLENTLDFYNKQIISCGDDARLESFPAYCIKNCVDHKIVHSALLEQYALPSLASESQTAQNIRAYASGVLRERRNTMVAEHGLLKDWHQAYHLFRLSAYWFVLGMEDFMEHKFEESLECFTIAYHTTVNLSESPPQGPSKTLSYELLMQYLRRSLLEVNHSFIKQFKLGEQLEDVMKSLRNVVPVIHFLQQRILKLQSDNSPSSSTTIEEDSQCLEEVRSQWCSLLGDDIAQESSKIISDVLRLILDPTAELCSWKQLKVMGKLSEGVDKKEDLELKNRYCKSLNNTIDMVKN